MFPCSFCNKRYKYRSELVRHELSHSQPFKCKVCSKKFSFNSALLRHEKQHKRAGQVQCPQCGRACPDGSLLQRHINYSHGGTFSCSKCNSIFHSELALQSHRKIHRPESEREYRCDFGGCGKTFNFAHNLNNHKLTHTNTKKYFCDFCGKGFVQANNLKIHLITHNDSSKWLYCGVNGCTKKFSSVKARKKHLSSHEKVVSSSAETAKPPDQLNVGVNLLQDESHNSLPEAQRNNSPAQDESEVEVPSIEVTNNKTMDSENEPIDFSLSSNEVEPIIRSCKAVLGCCLVNGDGEIRDNCLCSQMIDFKNGSIDHIEAKFNTDSEVDDQILSVRKSSELFGKPGTCKENFSKNNVKCNDCAFSEICDISTKDRDIENDEDCGIVAEMPTIQYKRDGTIKVEVKFDMDAVETDVPSESCEAALGACMVAAEAAERCLCRRMARPPRARDPLLLPTTP